LWCFAGVFAKNGWFDRGFLWCKRGGWVVKCGVLVASFLALKNAPRFLSLFFKFPFREIGGLLDEMKYGHTPACVGATVRVSLVSRKNRRFRCNLVQRAGRFLPSRP
jgi:hypothetical protein